MSIFKNLASRRGDDGKGGVGGGSASAKLLSMRDHAKAASPAPIAPSPAAATPVAPEPTPAPAPLVAAAVAPAAAPPAAETEGANVRSMWDLVVDDDADLPAAPSADGWSAGAAAPALADDAAEAPSRRAGRVRTRLLGFDRADGQSDETGRGAGVADPVKFPAGWLVVVEGPGRGASFALSHGVSQIGRGDDQAVPLDFGDTAISREGHAMIAYDDETRGFFIGHGGKSNIVRLNGRPVLSTEPVKGGDRIRIGETTLMLVALCGADFAWSGPRAPQ